MKYLFSNYGVGVMKVIEVIRYFDSKAEACRKIEVHHQSFAQWEKQGYIPLKHQFAFEVCTKKHLRACTDEYVTVSRKKFKLKLKLEKQKELECIQNQKN